VARSLIRALGYEVKAQPDVLQRCLRAEMPEAAKGSVFVGAGDSYAAALAAFYASRGRCIALDPYTLVSAPELTKGLEVYFISVSGKTSSNVAAAGRVRGLAKRTLAITADSSSPLAERCDEILALPMNYVPRTAGMLSFSLSLLTVMKSVGRAGKCDFASAYAGALSDHGEVVWGRGTTYFLGNSLAYPAALYAAAKTYEILGAKAHAELLEEFSHMELFSLVRRDALNVFSCFDPSDASARLQVALAKQRYAPHVIPCRGATDLEGLFHSVFVGQLSVLSRAKELGLKSPRFL